MRRLFAAVAGLALLVLETPTAAAPVGAEDTASPFEAWNPTVEPSADFPGGLTLEFDSPALGRRTTNTVFLPSSYDDDGAPAPAMYYLHGTVVAALDNPVVAPVTQFEGLLRVLSQGGGYLQTDLFSFERQRDRAEFVVVAPDTDRAGSFCHTCIWVDGEPANASPLTEVLAADTFLNRELQPLVESLFNVRSDRNGRGVMGFSMGGWGALLQGSIHPDRYRIVASVSGVVESVSDLPVAAVLEGVGFLRSQGYGPVAALDPMHGAALNPTVVGVAMVDAPMDVLFTQGTGCIGLLELTAPDCVAASAVLNPAAGAAEVLLARNNQIGQSRLRAAGLDFSSTTRPGVHGGNNATVFATDILPAANAAFANPLGDPVAFDYTTASEVASVWGFVFEQVAPSNMVRLQDVSLDGLRVIVTSLSDLQVTTPPAFEPGTTLTVTTTCAGSSTSVDVQSSATGQLTFVVPATGRTACEVLVAS